MICPVSYGSRMNLVCYLVLAGTSSVCSGEDRVHGPRLSVDSKVIDTGKALPGEIVHGTFTITNRGTQNLLLDTVKVSCSCILTRFDAVVGPDLTGRIDLSLKAPKIPGEYTEGVDVGTNDVKNRRLRLSLRVKVSSQVEFSPSTPYLSFGSVDRGKEYVFKFGVHSSAKGFSPEVEYSTQPYVAGTIERKPGSEGEVLSIRILPDAPLGPISAVVQLRTGLANEPQVLFTVFGSVADSTKSKSIRKLPHAAKGTGSMTVSLLCGIGVAD